MSCGFRTISPFCVTNVPQALTNENVSNEITDDALSLIVYSLCHSVVQAIQNLTTANDVWDKLQELYASKKLINNLEVLNNWLILMVKREELKRDHAAKMKTKLPRLVRMNDAVNHPIQVSILVSSLSNLPEYADHTASVNTMTEKKSNSELCVLELHPRTRRT